MDLTPLSQSQLAVASELASPLCAPETAPGATSDLKAAARRLAAHCADYRGADATRSILQLAVTTVPFFALVAVMVYASKHAYWLTLLLAIPAAGFLLRLFIIQHDCGHGSYFPWRTANDTLGRIISVLTFTPYGFWRRAHNQHHASSGNLHRRGVGDINTLTLKEYQSLPPLKRLAYRIYRNPIFLFGVGVPLHFTVLQRIPFGQPFRFREVWRSILALDLAIVVVYGLAAFLIGFKPLLMTAAPMLLLSSIVGGWLFFVQHQFEETHWQRADDWDFQVAAIHGSSYYVLPGILNWFTGNIGLHHIHHLSSMIPNYRLQDCLKASPELQSINRLTLWQSLRCVRLALWDEDARKLITFREARRSMAMA